MTLDEGAPNIQVREYVRTYHSILSYDFGMPILSSRRNSSPPRTRYLRYEEWNDRHQLGSGRLIECWCHGNSKNICLFGNHSGRLWKKWCRFVDFDPSLGWKMVLWWHRVSRLVGEWRCSDPKLSQLGAIWTSLRVKSSPFEQIVIYCTYRLSRQSLLYSHVFVIRKRRG